MGVHQAGPVDEPSLRKLLVRLADDSPARDLILLRLEYAEQAQLLNHYIGPAAGRPSKSRTKDPWLKPNGRCYPNMMPTQASGRWSTTEPPLATFPPAYRGIVIPDPGWCWVVWDWDAIEARLVACETNDHDDLRAFHESLDIHTQTACKTFRLPSPPDLKDPHTSPECAEWRATVRWGGKDDRRRHLAKTLRYALYYSFDERGVNEIKDVEKLAEQWGQSVREFRDTLFRYGAQYLASKPCLTTTRKRYMEECWRTHQSSTFLGRVRALVGDYDDVRKEGWNHRIQGAAAGIMNRTLIDIFRRYPRAVLMYQSHDSATVAFPIEDHDWWPGLRSLVERVWTVNGHDMLFSATWHVITQEGAMSPDTWMQRMGFDPQTPPGIPSD